MIPFALLCCVLSQTPAEKTKESELIKKSFGEVTDPKKDCEFKFDGKELKIKVGKGDHALHVLQKRMDAPRLLQEFEGDFTLEVKVKEEYPEEGTPAVKGKDFLFHSAGLLIWIDDKSYIRLEKARLFYRDRDPETFVNYEYFRCGEWPRSGRKTDGKLEEDKPAKVKLVRKGTKITGFSSLDDGKTWAELTDIEIDDVKKLKVGVVVNHNTLEEFMVTFSEFKIEKAK